MANLEKHKKKPELEWLEAEESDVPASPRSQHVLGAYVKIPKLVSRKGKVVLPPQAQPKPDVSLVREAAPPPRSAPKPSQTTSWEHLKRLERLPQLRAPYPARAGKAKPASARVVQPGRGSLNARGGTSTRRSARLSTGGKPSRRS